MSQSGPLHNPSEDWDKRTRKEDSSSKETINRANCPYKDGAVYWCDDCKGTGISWTGFYFIDEPCQYCSGQGWFLKSALEIVEDILSNSDPYDAHVSLVREFLKNVYTHIRHTEQLVSIERPIWEQNNVCECLHSRDSHHPITVYGVESIHCIECQCADYSKRY